MPTVQRASVWLFFVGIVECLAGCSHPFMPLGDDQVMIDVRISTAYRRWPDIFAQICKTYPDECGQRKIDEDQYELDSFYAEADSDGRPLYFVEPKNGETQEVRRGVYAQSLLQYIPDGQSIRVLFNDLPPSEVKLPPLLTLASPGFEEQILRSATPNLRLEWYPSFADSDIYWKTVPLTAPTKDDPCNALEWVKQVGQAEDVGVLELSWDLFPTNDLPAGGCQAMVVIERRLPGRLGEGIQGDIHSSAHTAAIIWILP